MCGQEFEPKNPKGTFCSGNCKTKFYRSQKKGNSEITQREYENQVLNITEQQPSLAEAEIIHAKIQKENKEFTSIGETIYHLLVELKMNAAEFVQHYKSISNLAKVTEKKQITPSYTKTTDPKVINPEAPVTKQRVEPPVGSNAWKLRNS